MTWIKLEDKAPRHPKVAGLSDKAFRIWVNALCYAGEFLTDGILPPAFLITVKGPLQHELLVSGLWERDGDRLRIHDYLGHQQSREKVEGKRKYAREQKQKVSGNLPVGSEKPTVPDSREQIQSTDTENREQQQQRPPTLIQSHKDRERRLQFCAFVGSKIEVPNGLHAELRDSHGGDDPERELQRWYLELNEQAETERWRIPRDKEFYPWFKALYGQKFPAPVITPKRDTSSLMARLEAVARGEAKR